MYYFLKKFFIVTILLSLANCPIAIAANSDIPIDWNKVPKISSKSDLAKYFENKKRASQNIIPVILTNGLTINAEEFLELCPSSLVSYKIVYNDGQNMRVIYETTEYPGTKVANAYLSGDTSRLNQEEMKLYKIAVGIINETNKQSDWKNKEMNIYYEITKRTTYASVQDFNHQPRQCTAIGALLDGKANCQGYSDAFYMLCRMLGWNVGRMSGIAGGSAHMWNTITMKNGDTYCVDVTWGDAALKYTNRKRKLNSYIYFNAPVEIMQVTHSWRWDLSPTIKGGIDNVYSYNNFKSSFARSNSAESGLKLLAKKIATRKTKWVSVMTPLDEKYFVIEQATKYLSTELNNCGYKGVYQLHIQKHGKYMFFTADTYED